MDYQMSKRSVTTFRRNIRNAISPSWERDPIMDVRIVGKKWTNCGIAYDAVLQLLNSETQGKEWGPIYYGEVRKAILSGTVHRDWNKPVGRTKIRKTLLRCLSQLEHRIRNRSSKDCDDASQTAQTTSISFVKRVIFLLRAPLQFFRR